MRVTVVGAGAMGSSYGALLALAGHDVHLVDAWREHVDAIEREGLHLDGMRGEHRVRLRAATEPEPGRAELAVLFTDANATRDAAGAIACALEADGCAITFQNGIGNVETLCEVLGDGRVLGGSSMCSAAVRAPGRVSFTHVAETTVGEIDGRDTPRIRAVAEALTAAGLPTRVDADVMATIWSKFVLNCAINALAAITGLRSGEIARLPELDALQDRVLDEVFAVTEAKAIRMPDPDFRAYVKALSRAKFNRPSMLQHVEAGRRTEIEALNAALVREARALGIPVPGNEAVVALLKGRELHERQRTLEPDLDHDAWEVAVAAGEDPFPRGWIPPAERE